MNALWNWLTRRRQPLRFGTMREVADEQGIHTRLQAYIQPPSLVGPDVQVRILSATPQPTTIISLDARRHRTPDPQPDYVAEMHDLALRYWLATEYPEGYYDGGDCA